MSDQYIGEIRLFGVNFAPSGWALCQGQTMPIKQSLALFGLIGARFGGDGITTFGLPNLQGVVAIGAGQGTGLSAYTLGQSGGAAGVTLDTTQIAPHSHTLPTATSGYTGTPSSSVYLAPLPGQGRQPGPPIYVTPATQATSSVPMANSGSGGGGLPHNNLAPYVVLNYCIALLGYFPPR